MTDPLKPEDRSVLYAREVSQALGRGGHPGAVVIPVPSLGNAPPAYSEPHNNVFTRTIALDNARTMEGIDITGNFVWVLDASSQNATFDLRFNEQYNSPFPVSLGLTLGGFRFNRAYISHAAQAGQWITILYGVQEPGSNLWINNPSQVVNTVEVIRAGNLTHGSVVVGAGAGLFLAANANRLEVIIGIETAGRFVNFGADNTIALTTGAEIQTGQTLTMATTAAIWAIASAAATTVRYLELTI